MSNRARPIVPITQLGDDHQAEHGRIRLGHKVISSGGKERPAKLTEFRFTSPDRQAIEILAGLYGGEVKAWSDPKANPQNQWEVKSLAKDMRIWLPSGGMSTWYEQWSGGGRARQCDGGEVEVTIRKGDDVEVSSVACICDQDFRSRGAAMICKPVTRLHIVIPEVPFGGLWRMQTQGWNAAQELPGVERMLAELQGDGIVEARLLLEERTAPGKKFVVPKLIIGHSPDEILAGRARIGQLASGPEGRAAELPAPVQAALPPWRQPADDEVTDAEIVDDVGIDEAERALDMLHAPRITPEELLAEWGQDAARKIGGLLDGSACWDPESGGRVIRA